MYLKGKRTPKKILNNISTPLKGLEASSKMMDEEISEILKGGDIEVNV